MRYYIEDSEDFGLGFNSMTRLYMDAFEEEILDDMLQVCDIYLKWFSQRTIVCSLRDLIGEFSFGNNDTTVPVAQQKQYEQLIKRLINQGVYREVEGISEDRQRNIIVDFGISIGIRNSFWGDQKGFDLNSFVDWIIENGLNKEIEIKEKENTISLPIKKSDFKLFYKVCNYMIRYSYGRHTYMPSTCRSFVNKNMILFSNEALQDISDNLKRSNSKITKRNGPFMDMDDKNWLDMQNDIKAELFRREYYKKAKDVGEKMEELIPFLTLTMDLKSLTTEEDCVDMFNKVLGIEKYLLEKDENENIHKAILEISKGKDVIIKKSKECFEKEEGQYYDKIRDGVYLRKPWEEIKHLVE